MSVPKPHIKRYRDLAGVCWYFFTTDRGFCIYGGYATLREAVAEAVEAHEAEVKRRNALKGHTYWFGKDAIFVTQM